MPKALITGVAGFIGSHLAGRLVKKGFHVTGIDSFEDYYPRWMKEKNIKSLREEPEFTFIETNLLSDNLPFLFQMVSNLKEVDYIFHQAAQAGVRGSWGKDFQVYTRNNILATQKLLELARTLSIKKFIYASSSSVYGDTENLPLKEDTPTNPVSPYGVSKLAAENLCHLYWKNYDLPTVSLRYFTVYGPYQRPDMAFHKFIRAIFFNEEIQIYGDGNQTRDFTYIDDVVEANLLALSASSGEVFNVGGGKRVSLMDAVHLMEDITGKRAKAKRVDAQEGDVRDTWADIEKAKSKINYRPEVPLEEGLKKEVFWLKELYKK